MGEWPLETEYGAYSIKGPLHSRNEDRFTLLGYRKSKIEQLNRGQMFAVFDGMGAAPRGADAAQYMCDELAAVFQRCKQVTPEKIRDALFQANMDLTTWDKTQSRSEEGACAGTAVWIHDRSMTVFHAGDTMGILLKFNAESDLEFNLFTPDQSSGHFLSNYYGMGDDLDIYIATQFGVTIR